MLEAGILLSIISFLFSAFSLYFSRHLVNDYDGYSTRSIALFSFSIVLVVAVGLATFMILLIYLPIFIH